MKLKFFLDRFLESTRNIKFYENSFNGSCVVFLEDRHMDRHDEPDSHFLHLFECA